MGFEIGVEFVSFIGYLKFKLHLGKTFLQPRHHHFLCAKTTEPKEAVSKFLGVLRRSSLDVLFPFL